MDGLWPDTNRSVPSIPAQERPMRMRMGVFDVFSGMPSAWPEFDRVRLAPRTSETASHA